MTNILYYVNILEYLLEQRGLNSFLTKPLTMKRICSIFCATALFLTGCSSDKEPITQQSMVTIYDTVTIAPVAKGFDLSGALAEGETSNFYHYSNFSYVYKEITTTRGEVAQPMTAYTLEQDVTLAEVVIAIHAEPQTPNQFAGSLNELANTQRNGEKGILQTNGSGNIFYVQVALSFTCAVQVSWGSTDHKWYLEIAPIDGVWGSGRRLLLRSGVGN